MTKLKDPAAARLRRAVSPGGSRVFSKSRLRLYSVSGLAMGNSPSMIQGRSTGLLPAGRAGTRGLGLAGLGRLATLAALASAQAAFEQFGQVHHIGALAFFVLLAGLYRLDFAGVSLLLDQRHDVFLEGIVIFVRLPFAGHVLHQALGHIQFLGGG